MDPSGTVFLQLSGELAAIVASEVLTRKVFPLGKKDRSLKPLWLQCVVLFMSSLLIVALLHRAPPILLLACVYLGARMAVILLQRRQISSTVNPTVSQRLHVAAELDDSDNEDIGHAGNFRPHFGRQPLNYHSPIHRPLKQPLTQGQEGSRSLSYNGGSSWSVQTNGRGTGTSGSRPWQTQRPPLQRSTHYSVPQVRRRDNSTHYSVPQVRRRDNQVNETLLHHPPVVTSTTPLTHSTSYLSQTASPSPSPSPSPSSLLPPLFSHSMPFSFFSSRPAVSTTPPGLINPGNRCFLNVVLQCLAWTSEFDQCLASASTNDETLAVFVTNLTTVLNFCRVLPDETSTFNSIDPTELLGSLSQIAPHLVVSPAGSSYQSQQDVAELLLFLLDQIHNIAAPSGPSPSSNMLSEKKEHLLSELSAIKSEDIVALREPLSSLAETDWLLYTAGGTSDIHKLFLGQLVEARECQNCRQFSVSTEYFTILPLPLPPPQSRSCQLLDCFRTFTEVEDMSEGNMLHCSFCQQSQNRTSLAPGKRLALLTKPPKVLVCQLSRYSYNSFYKSASKSNIHISVPLSIDLYPFTLEAKLSNTPRKVGYDLYAICAHSGAQTTTHGHYVCYCQAANGQWYYYNDEEVRAVNIRRELESSFVTENAYLLFYALKNY